MQMASHEVLNSELNLLKFFLIILIMSATVKATTTSTTTTADEGQSQTPLVPALYMFGDSLVDVGNNNFLATFLKGNYPHNGIDYSGGVATGRFSNGKNPADFLAEKLNLPTAPPFLSDKSGIFLQGVSFASGGAGILDNPKSTFLDNCMFLSQQIGNYSELYKKLVEQLADDVVVDHHFSKSLFAIVVGSNDILGYFHAANKIGTASQFVDRMIFTLEDHLKRMYSFGARKFLMFGGGPIGCTPAESYPNETHRCNEELNFWTMKFNDGVKLLMKRFKSSDINYSYFDVYKAMLEMTQNPSTYGFTEVIAACCGVGHGNSKIGCLPISAYCSNRSKHLFWDKFHPTEKASSILIDFLFSNSSYTTPISLKELIVM